MSLVRYTPCLLNTSALADGGLFAYQRVGVEWLLSPVPGHDRRVRVLADGTGLGKSVQAMAVVDHELTRDPSVPVLLTAPANMLDQWAVELARLLPTVTVHRITKDSYLDADAQVFLCSHQVLDRQAEGLAEFGFGLVIVDELAQVGKASIASKYKPVRLVRPKQLQALGMVAASAPAAIGLTATLAENDLVETFGFLDAIGVRGLPRWSQWREWLEYNGGTVFAQVNYCQDIPPLVTGVTDQGAAEIRANLGIDLAPADPSQMILVRSSADVGLSMPVRVGETLVPVPLTQGREVAYRAASGLSEGLERHQARQQVSRFHNGESALVNAAIDRICNRLADQKVIVYAENLAVIDLLDIALDIENVPTVRIDGQVTDKARAKAIQQHRDPDGARVLLGTKTLERGLNLQHCRVMLSLDPTYNPAAEQQREGRICRIGSPHDTYEHVVLIPDVEHSEWKLEKLNNKYAAAVKVGLARPLPTTVEQAR